jgi:hypothetical protein
VSDTQEKPCTKLGDGKGQDERDAQRPARGQVGAFHQVRRPEPDHHRRGRDGHRKGHRVPDQLTRERAVQQGTRRAPAGIDRLEDDEDQR